MADASKVRLSPLVRYNLTFRNVFLGANSILYYEKDYERLLKVREEQNKVFSSAIKYLYFMDVLLLLFTQGAKLDTLTGFPVSSVPAFFEGVLIASSFAALLAVFSFINDQVYSGMVNQVLSKRIGTDAWDCHWLQNMHYINHQECLYF